MTFLDNAQNFVILLVYIYGVKKKKEGYYSLGLLLRILYLLVLDKKSETMNGSLEEDIQEYTTNKSNINKKYN